MEEAMTKQTKRAHLAGAYIVKAAESRPTLVQGKTVGKPSTPTQADKNLASALLRAKSAA
jgi:hypothetical protein